MKKLIIIIFIVAGGLCWAQEPILIHYNFSFEKEYSYLTNDLNFFTISICNSNKDIIYNRTFENKEIIRDIYGSCIIADTIYSVIHSKNNYTVKTEYQTKNRPGNYSLFNIGFPDTVDQIALEVYFDQTVVSLIDTVNFKKNKFPDFRYDLNPDPKPVLIVKLINENPVMLMPCLFMYGRLNPRPMYLLNNNSNSDIFTAGKGLQSYFFGYLYKLDTNNTFKHSFPGYFCGNVGGKNLLKPGETEYVEEGYVIGEPNKMEEGFYKFSVNYIQNEDSSKSAVTYFSLIYSK